MVQALPDEPGRLSLGNRWWIVSGMGLVVFMASFDMSIVNVALPAIRDTLRTSTTIAQWVVLGYLLPLVALALPAGRWLDGVDRRNALVGAGAGFAVSSLAAGLAPAIGWLIAARLAQGLFGTVLMALVPVLITTSVEARKRGRAMGLVDTLGMLGLISGPGIGGLLVASTGWQWIFYGNVPACLALIVLALAQVRPYGGTARPRRGAVVEAVCLSGAAGAVMIAFTMATGHGPQWLALGLVAVPLIVPWRRLRASRPVRRLLVLPEMRGPLAALGVTATATGLLFYLVPYYLLTEMRTPTPVAGMTMLAFPLAAAVLGPLAGLLADRYGAQRIALVGMAVLVCGLLTLVPAGRSWNVADVGWRLTIAGAGLGLFNAPNMSAAMSAAPGGLLATTGAMTSVARQGGFAFGPAAATLVWGLADYRIGGIRDAFAAASVLVAVGAVPLSRCLWSGRRLGSEHR